MFNIAKNTHIWLPEYLKKSLKKKPSAGPDGPVDIFLSICDHFEPLWQNADRETGLKRVERWHEKYPEIANRYRDCDGELPKYTFFYPIEEYIPEYMELLASLCENGYGEVEVHLHHDNDTPENLKKALLDFKDILSKKHSLLSKDKHTGEVRYGFIHGNWALCNSRPDGRLCGVNNELNILKETGCYADFTMPSAPDITQTAKINSIYYSETDKNMPKAHNSGRDAEFNKNSHEGLLMVQGPLALNWRNRKYHIAPRIENSFIGYDNPVTPDRIKLWIGANIHVKNRPDHIFIKLHTHGCQEKNSEYLLNRGLDDLFSNFRDHYNEGIDYRTHFVSAREMVNVIHALEDGRINEDMKTLRDYKYVTAPVIPVTPVIPATSVIPAKAGIQKPGKVQYAN